MTRKDYILIAKALHFEHQAVQEITVKAVAVWNVAKTIALALHQDNPRFDSERFLDVVRGNEVSNSRPVSSGSHLRAKDAC